MTTTSNAAPDDVNYDEAAVPEYALPPLLPSGGTLEDWQRRRPEILALFEKHVYGKTPEGAVDVAVEVLEESDDALDGKAVRRQLRLTFLPMGFSPTNATGDDRSVAVDVLIYAPKDARGPVPAFLGLNFAGNHSIHPDPAIRRSAAWMREDVDRGGKHSRWLPELLVDRGYALVTAYYGDIDPDKREANFSDGVHPLFYDPGQTRPADDQWGAIGAWAWGLSRIRDVLENEPLVDADRVAVIGHSRLGKTALWAGAQDENFALVISNDSGCGGAALYRRCYGERIQHITGAFPHWFCKNHLQYSRRESELPVDQHMLLALVAPRPLYVASAVEDRWADPKGEFLSARHASRIYELYGKSGLPADEMPKVDEPAVGQIGYHVRRGKHDVTRYDWQQYLDFADEHL